MNTANWTIDEPERCLGGVRYRCGVIDTPTTFAAVAFGNTEADAIGVARLILIAPELLAFAEKFVAALDLKSPTPTMQDLQALEHTAIDLVVRANEAKRHETKPDVYAIVGTNPNYTTGQVAKLCKVAPRQVSKWFDSGRLKGFRIPGSQDRRIPHEYLLRFLKSNNMGELAAEIESSTAESEPTNA